MDCSLRNLWLVALLGAVAGSVGCSIGNGAGELTGPVVGPDCEVDEPDYALQPSFFSGELTGEQMNIRVQRGSDLEGFADGLMIHVRDVNDVFRNRIGLPIEVTNEYRGLIRMSLYLNETCKTGFPDEFRSTPLILEGVGGTITFRAIYAPDIEPGATLTEAILEGVEFRDAEHPERSATLGGDFSFFYQRGSPAQRFP